MDQCAGIDIGCDGSDFFSSFGMINRPQSEEMKVALNEGASFTDDSTRTIPVTKRWKLSVSFGNIEVRKYGQTLLGDLNPAHPVCFSARVTRAI